MGDALISALLILHALVAVGLLGAVTHQAVAVIRGPRDGGRSSRHRSVDASDYTGAVVALFAAGTLIGGLLYPSYRVIVRPVLELHNLRVANGAFEIKEHLSALGLLMLPAYWAAWRKPLIPDAATARAGLTWILAAIVWWNFLIGGVVDNIKGLFH